MEMNDEAINDVKIVLYFLLIMNENFICSLLLRLDKKIDTNVFFLQKSWLLSSLI